MDIDLANIRKLDFSTLLVFVELIRHRRTTVAAKQLSLSQSAISHALGRLRDIFNDPLFLRRSNGLQPTPRALELAPKITAIIRLTGEAIGASTQFEPESSDRTFRLAANDLVATTYGAPLLRAISKQAPLVRTTFRFAVSQAALEGLRDNVLDVALGRFYSLPKDFVALPLTSEAFIVIARAGHTALKRGLSLELFCRLEHLMVSFSGGLTGVVDAALKEKGLSRQVRASLPMFLSVFATVAQSDLIATVPMRLAKRYANAFQLNMHDLPVDVEQFPITLIRHVRTSNDTGIDWLAKNIQGLSERL